MKKIKEYIKYLKYCKARMKEVGFKEYIDFKTGAHIDWNNRKYYKKMNKSWETKKETK